MSTLLERINGHSIELFNYLKYQRTTSGKSSGNALLNNEVANLSIVDLDGVKNIDAVLKLLSDQDIIVQTANNGVHIYCDTNKNKCVNNNRMVKYCKTQEFDVDIFSAYDSSKKSLVVLPGSEVYKKDNSLGCYKVIRGDFNNVITRTLNDVLTSLKLTTTNNEKEDAKTTDEDYEINEYNFTHDEEVLLINGLKGITSEIHGGCSKISKNITVLILFKAINSFSTEELVNEAYDIVKTLNLTEFTKANFESKRNEYRTQKTTLFILKKIIKIYNNEYYKKYFEKEPMINKIDLKDSFTLIDLNKLYYDGKYKKNENLFIEDLSKCLRFVNSNKSYIEKVYDNITNEYVMKYSTLTYIDSFLRQKKIEKKMTCYQALQKYLHLMSVEGVCFNNQTNSRVLNVFNGYKDTILNECDVSVIQDYLDLVFALAADDENVYNYIINWLAKMFQHPGEKNGTAIIFKSVNGCGKNVFTNIIADLLGSYAERNITNIEELTGQFNSCVELKMFIVLNELKNSGEDRMCNFDALKSIITDSTIRINEKSQPRRTAENNSNCIFLTNNSYPLKITSDDRRYVVSRCSPTYCKNYTFFKSLVEKSQTKEFKDNLLTFFMKRDLKDFIVNEIPNSESRMELIDASKSSTELFVDEYREQLKAGIECESLKIYCPQDIKLKNFQLRIKDFCSRKQKRIEGERKWYYVLNDSV